MPRKKILNTERVMVRLKSPTVFKCLRRSREVGVCLSEYLRGIIEKEIWDDEEVKLRKKLEMARHKKIKSGDPFFKPKTLDCLKRKEE